MDKSFLHAVHTTFTKRYTCMLFLCFCMDAYAVLHAISHLKLHNDKFQCYLFLLIVMLMFVYVLIVLMLCFYNMTYLSIAFFIIAVLACTCNAIVGMTYYV